MNKIKYKIKEEIVILEKNKYYDIIKYQKGNEKLSYFKKMYGKSNDKKYYKYLLTKEKNIFKKVNLFKKLNLLKNIIYLYIKTI